MVDRLAENGAVQYGQDRWSFENNDSRLAGAGHIANEIRRLVEEGKYTDYVSGLSVKGRLINRMIDVVYWPRKLFAAGEVGTWFDPSDMTTLFQDAAGTTPVTAVEQPVSLMLDKSKGLALGPELVTNGTFDTDATGWSAANVQSATPSVVSGELYIQNSITASAAGAIQTLNLTVGKTYKVSGIVRRQAGDYVHIAILNNAQSAFVAQGAQITATTNIPVELYFTATETNNKIYLRGSSASLGSIQGYFDNISVKEIAGNHAYQTTSTARPVLRARYNLLTYSEQFDNAAWTKTRSSITANATTAPDGTNTADKIVEDTSASNSHLVYYTPTTNFTSGVQYTVNVFYKKSERTQARIATGAVLNINTIFDLSNGTVVSGSGNITSVGNDWWLCSVTATAASSGVDIIYFGTALNGSGAYTGNGTSGVFIWGADIRVSNDGVNIPSYQRIAAATDYDTVNFPPYLRFDGSDDYMLTNSIDFTGTDKMTVFAGVRKLSDAALQTTITELSASSTLNNGSFWLAAPWTSFSGGYGFRNRGTAAPVAFINGSPAAPVTNVLTGIGNISGDSVALNINGIQANIDTTTDQGTGNYGNYPLYIGRRGGTTLPFNGRLYGLIVRGAQSTEAEITNTETWMNNKTGAWS